MDKEVFWKKCLLEIKQRIPEQAYQTWFDGIKISDINDSEVRIQVPNQFHYEWLGSKYQNIIESTINTLNGNCLKIIYDIEGSNGKTDLIPPLIEKQKPKKKRFQKDTRLNTRYLFENFIEGRGNQLAKAAAESVSNDPGQTPYNPLLIYSETGLGKTHLLQAIGNHAVKHQPKAKTAYLTSEKFVRDFIGAIQMNKAADFATTYRSVDLLLLDDVQVFQKKNRHKNSFFIFLTICIMVESK